MTRYAARRGARTGATVWRVLSEESELRVAPDGVMDLMWFQDRLVVAGADTRTRNVDTQPGEVTWGLQFAAGVAHVVLGVPAQELTDHHIELAELVTLPFNLGCDFEVDPPSALEDVFVALWARADPDRAALRLAASLDRAARDGRSVRDTAKRHYMSERSLRRLSNALFGYGPKTLMQIRRFQHATDLARSGVGSVSPPHRWLRRPVPLHP